ncbi:transposase [Devosia sp. MC532]|nr:transposase [Devosia sp. MC532]
MECFYVNLRDERLKGTLFTSLAHALFNLTAWQEDYNTVRPRGSLENFPPVIYAKLIAPNMQWDGAPSK